MQVVKEEQAWPRYPFADGVHVVMNRLFIPWPSPGWQCQVVAPDTGESLRGFSTSTLQRLASESEEMLAASKGSVISVHAAGEDAEAAVEALAMLVSNRFDED